MSSPTPPQPAGPRPEGPESILVYGADPIGVVALATGLALRSHGAFAWADCAAPALAEDNPTHWILSRGDLRPGADRVDEAALGPAAWSWTGLRDLVALDGGAEESRLTGFLELPELLQRLAARAPEGGGRAAILLANVDRLPAGSATGSLERAAVHRRLHEGGVTLVVTALVPPGADLRAAFDRVVRLEVPEGTSWAHGLVALEKWPGAEPLPAPVGLRDLWGRWELDPSLLPPV
jgi:hypothetical protein